MCRTSNELGMEEESKSKNRIKGPLIAFLLMLSAFALCEFVAQPFGDFPMNDDWSYAVGVKNLVDTGKLTLTSWTLGAAIFHVCSAALFCKLFSFSYESLRAYTLLLGAGGLTFLALLMRKVGTSWTLTIPMLLFVLTNPLFFSLANTFMMDVCTTALLLGSFYFLFESSENEGYKRITYLWMGSAFALFAVSNRQVSVVLFLAYFLSMLYLRRSKKSKAELLGRLPSLLEAAAPLIVSLAFLAAHGYWLANFTGIPFCVKVEKAFLEGLIGSGIGLLLTWFTSGLRLLVYMGLLCLPQSLLSFPAMLSCLSGKSKKLLLMISLELMVLLPAALIISRNIMPLGDNIIYDFGVGPNLMTAAQAPVPDFAHAPKWLWMAVTAFSGAGMALLLGNLVGIILHLKEPKKDSAELKQGLIVKTFLIMAGFWMIALCSRGFFDRYLVLMICVMTVVFSSQLRHLKESSKPLRITCVSLSIICAVVLGAYSVLGTRDCFSWNRARWSALNEAMQNNIEPARINGGYEFNHWYVYEPGNKITDITKDDEPQHNDEFAVSMQELAGYKIEKTYPFDSVLWGNGHSILFSKKMGK